MTVRQVRDLAIRILGLYYFACAIIHLPQALGLFYISDKETEYIAHKGVFVIASIVPMAMYFLVAYLLCFKTRGIMALLWPTVDEEPESMSNALPLATWVSLIGLFYLIGSLGGAASELWRLGVKRDVMGSWLSYKALPEVITVVLAVVCIIKARQIAECLNKPTGLGAQQPPSD